LKRVRQSSVSHHKKPTSATVIEIGTLGQPEISPGIERVDMNDKASLTRAESQAGREIRRAIQRETNLLSAVINGIVAVPLMFLLMLISEKRAIVGKFVLPPYLRVVGWIATGVMLIASLGFLITALHQSFAR